MSTEQQEIVKPKKTWAELAEDEDEEIAQSENAIRDVDSIPEPAFIKTQSEYVNKTYNRKGGYNKEGRKQNNRQDNGLKDYRQKTSEYEPAKYDNTKKQHYQKGQSGTQGGGGIKGRIETLLLQTKQETVNIIARIQEEQPDYKRLEDHFSNNYQEMDQRFRGDNILLRVSPQTALQLLRNIGIQGEIDGQLVKLSYPKDDQERPYREPKQRVEPEVLDRHFYKPSKPTTVVTRSMIKVEEQAKNDEEQRVKQHNVDQQHHEEQFNERNRDRDDNHKHKHNDDDEQPIQEFNEQIRPNKYESTHTSTRYKQSYNKSDRFPQQSQYVEKSKVDDEPHSNNDRHKPQYPKRGKNNYPQYEYQVKYEEVPQPAQESPVQSDDEHTSSAKKKNKKKKPHRKQSENSTNPFSALAQK